MFCTNSKKERQEDGFLDKLRYILFLGCGHYWSRLDWRRRSAS
jgi:hypothetical protein